MAALDDLVEDLAGLMGASCILEDPDLRLLGFSDQRDVDVVRQRSILERGSSQEVRDWFYAHGILDAEGPLRTPADQTRGIVSRVCVPVRHLGRLQGFFWVLDADGAIDEARWPEAAPIAEEAGALLSLAERRQARRDAVYREVVEGGPSVAGPAAVELAGAAGLRVDESVVVALVERADLATQLASRPSRGGMLWVRESGGLCAAIVRDGILDPPMTLREVLTALGLSRRVPELDRTTLIGIGPLVPTLDDLADARSGALVALRVARESGDHVTSWEQLGPLTLLGIARDADLARALMPVSVRKFLEMSPESLVETAHVYLEEAANVVRTATRLGLHRQTVYHRLDAIERATGIDLATGGGRLTLHLALELAPYVSAHKRVPDSPTEP
ncbi:helix-turn-helix domain-containing protein [Nocardioides sp. W7]|uniref:PucR family transcriptional regulator n=1 Tax=Nocardioides sp. W7 TaxID=2931390 RepID=UPI001FD36248|nr:helix-turn-helix domain-containing protein [Nocardioides sp. W7]